MSIQERTLSVEFSSRHLAGDRSVSSDGGDIDGKQVGSASISSRENSLASDSQRNQANKNHRDGAAHRAHPDRTEGGRGYYCGNNTRYCESYESKNPSPVVPRHHRMSPSKTDRFYRHGHIDTTIGNHAYNEHLSVPLLPPPSRMDLAPSFSGYVDHYLPCPPMQDFDRPIEYTYPTIPPHSDIPSSGSIGADRWLPHSPHRGERGQPHVSRDSSIHHLEWRRYGGTHSGLGNPHPYSGGMRHPPNPSGPVDRLQKYSY